MVTFLLFVFKDCSNIDLRRRIECGEFWFVACYEGNIAHSRRTIGSLPAILADTWEENARPGRTLYMCANDLTPRELEVVHKTWDEHVVGSLPGIFELTEWHENFEGPSRGSLARRLRDEPN